MKTSQQRLAWAMERCRGLQIRATPMRKAILAFLADRRVPVTLDMVAQGDQIRGGCNATTIYRTLMMFQSAELVRLIGTLRKVSYFVLNVPGESSHFLICYRCGCIIELLLPHAMAEAIQQIASAQGFSPLVQDCEVYGYCKSCQVERQHQVIPSKLVVKGAVRSISAP